VAVGNFAVDLADSAGGQPHHSHGRQAAAPHDAAEFVHDGDAQLILRLVLTPFDFHHVRQGTPLRFYPSRHLPGFHIKVDKNNQD
jgi:hypothetical protein